MFRLEGAEDACYAGTVSGARYNVGPPVTFTNARRMPATRERSVEQVQRGTSSKVSFEGQIPATREWSVEQVHRGT